MILTVTGALAEIRELLTLAVPGLWRHVGKCILVLELAKEIARRRADNLSESLQKSKTFQEPQNKPWSWMSWRRRLENANVSR